MSDLSDDSTAPLLCAICGGTMIVTQIYSGGTATPTTIQSFSSSASSLQNMYWNQILYTCKDCGTTLLKPNVIQE